MIYDANEKYIAVNKNNEIIEIHEIPKENENSKPASEEIKIVKNIYKNVRGISRRNASTKSGI